MHRLRSEYPWTQAEQDTISRFLKAAEQEFLAEKVEKEQVYRASGDTPSLKKAFQGALWAHYHVREIRRQWEAGNATE